MNYWMDLSIQYANQKSYLDDLFSVYPTVPNGIRDIDENIWALIENAFNIQDNRALIAALLKLEKFSIKDSYVAFLRLDAQSILRNPKTIDRLAGTIYALGLDKLFEKCSEPKETNTQMGQMFVNWINRKTLGITPVPLKLFGANNENAILEGSDKILGTFAKTNFGYSKNKGLDFVARFNQKYVFAEAKFITSSGGNQDKSFEDVISTLTANYTNATAIGIIDGVVWLKEKTALYKKLTTQYSHLNIMSSLVLREFLYQL